MKHRLVVKLSHETQFLRICTYTRAHGIGIFYFREDMIREILSEQRPFYLDLDGCHFCSCHRFYDGLSFRVTFLKAEGDFDHLSGRMQFFSVPVDAVRRLLEDGRPRCFVFEPDEKRLRNHLNLGPGAAGKLKSICADPLKCRALSKALREIDEPFTLVGMHRADSMILVTESGAERSLMLMEDYVRGTDSDLYPAAKYA